VAALPGGTPVAAQRAATPTVRGVVAGSYFTTAGGPYHYAYKAFGPFLGFQVGWVTWLVRATSLGALSSGLATYLGYFWPAAALGLQKQGIVTGVFVSLVVVNILVFVPVPESSICSP
jgi:amino acid transporter